MNRIYSKINFAREKIFGFIFFHKNQITNFHIGKRNKNTT